MDAATANMLSTIALPRLLQERTISSPPLVSRIGATVSNALTRVRQNAEARTEKLLACDRGLRNAGWMTMVPLQRGLPFASIVLRGTSLFGVGVRDDDRWTEEAQRDLLDRCAQDGLSGLVLMGRPADAARSLNRVEFVEVIASSGSTAYCHPASLFGVHQMSVA